MKTDSYYTPGNPKRSRTMTVEWYKRAWLKAFTQEEVIAKIKALPDLEFIKEFNRIFIPKVNINENNGLQINLILTGIEGKKAIQGQIVGAKELPGHDTE